MFCTKESTRKYDVRIASIAIAVVMAFGVVLVPEVSWAESEYKTKTGGYTYSNGNGEYTIPEYDGDVCETIEGGSPKFDDSDMTQEVYQSYSGLDGKGRAGICEGNLDKSLMPTWSRGSIGVDPTGWINKSYSIVSGGWLYNRCHLIGWQLTGYDKEKVGPAELKKNLITGTRALNVGSGSGGMVGYENDAADYIKENKENNLLYRVTPVYDGDNLVADGVIMEGKSVDDNGGEVSYCVFVYNVQPGIAIDYATGDNKLEVDPVQPVNLSNCTVNLSASAFAYTGGSIAPGVTVYNGETVVDPSTYTVSYRNNVNVGTAYAVINPNGSSCVGSKTVAFTINPKGTKITKISKGRGKLTVKWAKQSKQVTGYQVRCSLNPSMASPKSKTVKSYKTTKTTVSKLKKKKTYYVQVRTYKTVSGKKYYSDWSSIKTKKTK